MDLRESIINQNNVTLNITKHLFSKEGKDKPSVFAVGTTLDQLLSFLRSNSIDHLNSFVSQLISGVLYDGSLVEGPRLSFINNVWVERSISLNSSFKHILDNDYKAIVASVDFQTKVNQFVFSFLTTCLYINMSNSLKLGGGYIWYR
ncbi:putative Serpin domain-containing protein [Lupinus albus]|uniref:Putative Serpin domain-containing protein n=1 Tax=Lupinus albus TaxID=3870 RepID=A0A6A4N678_LUPAL|nr:putative Serpin domain-containing protein [Lupinus albus]